VAGNGNGYNGRYTTKQFIDAMPGTGGVISALADKVGCCWHTAKKYVTKYATVRDAWEAERNRITDVAEDNIIRALRDGDLAMSKWWLRVMRREEFNPPQRFEHTGEDGGSITIEYVNDWREETSE